MTAFIDYSNIPIQLRITNRHLIDPEYRANYQQLRSGGKKRRTEDEDREIGIMRGRARDVADSYGIGLKIVYRLRKLYRRKNGKYKRGE